MGEPSPDMSSLGSLPYYVLAAYLLMLLGFGIAGWKKSSNSEEDYYLAGRGQGFVVTVMTNLGFRRSMAEAGIEVVDTKVGDRYVLEALDGRGLSIGGEQSGHVIFRDLASTGDGMLTAVQPISTMPRQTASSCVLSLSSSTALTVVSGHCSRRNR